MGRDKRSNLAVEHPDTYVARLTTTFLTPGFL